MAFSLYDVTVPEFIRALNAASNVLAKGRAHYEESGNDPDAINDLKLCNDMAPLTFQARSMYHHSIGAIKSAMEGVFTPPPAIELPDFAATEQHLKDAVSALEELSEDDVNALDGKEMVFKIGEHELPQIAHKFLLSFNVPNFYFHATTAYDLLRQQGTPLGKMDYLGRS